MKRIMKSNIQNIKTQRKTIKQKPGVSQALWLVPLFGAGKNLFETLIIGKDSITSREFTTKEQIFKTISGMCAVSSRGVVRHNAYHDQEVLDTLIIVFSLQITNQISYMTGVYYSGELKKTLQYHKNNVSQKTQEIINTTKKIGNNTKKIVEQSFSKKNKEKDI